MTMAPSKTHSDTHRASGDDVLAPRPFWVVLMPLILFIGVSLIGAATVIVMAYVGGAVAMAYGLGMGLAALGGIAILGIVASLIYSSMYSRWSHALLNRWTEADTRSLRRHLPYIATWPEPRVDDLLTTLTPPQQRLVRDYLDQHNT